MLTPLQEQVASTVAGLAEAEGFALAGGAALIVRGEIHGRAEARAFIDLAAVEARYGLDRLFPLAAEKDHGLTREMFAETAGRFSRLRPEEFGLDPAQYEQLERRVFEWQERARSR